MRYVQETFLPSFFLFSLLLGGRALQTSMCRQETERGEAEGRRPPPLLMVIWYGGRHVRADGGKRDVCLDDVIDGEISRSGERLRWRGSGELEPFELLGKPTVV